MTIRLPTARAGWIIALVATAAAALIAGCGSNASSPSSGGAAGSSTGTAGGSGPTATAGQNKVTIDGQDQGAVQRVQCNTMNDGLKIKIFMGDHGVVAILSAANPPEVTGVQFSNTVLTGGPTVEYDSRQNEGNGTVTKDGNTYTITGTGMTKDSSDSSQQQSKSFEVDVTCP
jgi:ipoprotein LpqH